jgi:GNAT superfamily N-acetyltransferase
MSSHVDLELAEMAAMEDAHSAVSEEVRHRHGIAVDRVGGALCTFFRDATPPLVFNRIVGLGIERVTTEADIDAVIQHARSRCKAYQVAVSPEAQPPELPLWLEARGFRRGYAWAKFRRSVDAPPNAETDLVIELIDTTKRDAFAETVVRGFGFAEALKDWVSALPGRSEWACFVAWDGVLPVGAAALHVRGATGWLGFAATLPDARRRGAQNALLAARIREAALRGARTLVIETGEKLPDKPSNSYRNILRAGFEIVYIRQNYVAPESA